MKLIEKTCPKCGANLEFEPGAKEVKCSYCNKEFIIEGNDNNSENFNSEDIKLISNAGKGITVVAVIIISIIAFSIICFSAFRMFNKEKSFENFRSTDNITSVNNISKADQNKIEEKSLTELKNWNEKQEEVSLTSHKNLGYYLIYNDFNSNLYDVYELNYNINGTNHVVYTAVQYMNVNYKNKKLTVGNGIIFGKILSYDMYSLWGYESIKDLYNDIDVDDEKIDASEGLYVD